MSVERFRDRLRSSGPAARNLRPDAISRRAARAARDRQVGPPPEQVPTGWYRHTFRNTPQSAPATGRLEPGPPAVEPDRAHRRFDRPRRQVGRVLDPVPGRRPRPMLALTCGLGLVTAAGAVVALFVWAGSGAPPASDPGPVEQVTAVPSAPASAMSSPSEPAAPSPAAPSPAAPPPTPPAAVPPTLPTAVPITPAEPGPAVVSTLIPGDPGFGWPSAAFGSPQS
ncbi:MAG TPA: hypothetical protein VIC62_01185 [Nakamurella sp.]